MNEAAQLDLFGDVAPAPSYTPPRPLAIVKPRKQAPLSCVDDGQAHNDDGHEDSVVAALLADKTPDMNPKDFYRSPDALADELACVAGIAELLAGARVLEPSAGTGALADAITRANPALAIECCEAQRIQQRVLAGKGYQVVASDFLAYTPPSEGYAAIVMNPPFKDATAHFYHAWDCLADGGVLACIGPGNWGFGSRKALKAVRTFIEERGVWWKNDSVEFEALGKKTSVGFVTVVLAKGRAVPEAATARKAEVEAARAAVFAESVTYTGPLLEDINRGLLLLTAEARKAEAEVATMVAELIRGPWETSWEVGL